MIYVMAASYLNNAVILLVFAIIILILGVYVLWQVRGMRKKEMIPTFLVPESERERIRKPAEFCKAIRPASLGLGITCTLYGIYEIFEYLLIKSYMAKVIGAVALIVIAVVFYVRLTRMRREYT